MDFNFLYLSGDSVFLGALRCKSLIEGGAKPFNATSSYLTTSTTILWYLSFDYLNSAHQLWLWSLIRPVYDASLTDPYLIH